MPLYHLTNEDIEAVPRETFSALGVSVFRDGRTYAVTNQIGTNVERVLSELLAAFPFSDVSWERSKPPEMGTL